MLGFLISLDTLAVLGPFPWAFLYDYSPEGLVYEFRKESGAYLVLGDDTLGPWEQVKGVVGTEGNYLVVYATTEGEGVVVGDWRSPVFYRVSSGRVSSNGKHWAFVAEDDEGNSLIYLDGERVYTGPENITALYPCDNGSLYLTFTEDESFILAKLQHGKLLTISRGSAIVATSLGDDLFWVCTKSAFGADIAAAIGEKKLEPPRGLLVPNQAVAKGQRLYLLGVDKNLRYVVWQSDDRGQSWKRKVLVNLSAMVEEGGEAALFFFLMSQNFVLSQDGRSWVFYYLSPDKETWCLVSKERQKECYDDVSRPDFFRGKPVYAYLEDDVLWLWMDGKKVKLGDGIKGLGRLKVRGNKLSLQVKDFDDTEYILILKI